MFYLTTDPAHFILRLTGVEHIVKDHLAREEARCRN